MTPISHACDLDIYSGVGIWKKTAKHRKLLPRV